jgi:hypothetical protein
MSGLFWLMAIQFIMDEDLNNLSDNELLERQSFML